MHEYSRFELARLTDDEIKAIPFKLHNKEDAPLREATGPVPEGHIRAEILKSCWVPVSPGSTETHRLFRHEVMDLPEETFEMLYKKQWARQQWTKPQKKSA